MKKQDFQQLVGKYVKGTASEAEIRLLEAYYLRLAGHYDSLPADQEESLRKEMLNEIRERAGIQPARVVSMWRRMIKSAAAAAILVAVGTGTYFFWRKNPTPPAAQTQVQRFHNDVQPGGNKAVLTLSNGSQIILDSAHNGLIAKQGNASIVNANDGKLAYNAGQERPTGVIYNVLTTPRGGGYQLVLPDGTKAWLNAESSIRYPVAFTGKNRQVEVTGEVYFEVAHNKNQPFSVKAGAQTIEDIGTAFNINAYPDEPAIKTTLLEGSVQMSSAGKQASILNKPGQQAEMTKNGNMRITDNVDIDEVLAWKNGLFRFNDASIRTILQQATRWYDIQVDYQTDNKLGFVATISRNVAISKLLKILELTDRVHFTIDGKKITVLP